MQPGMLTQAGWLQGVLAESGDAMHVGMVPDPSVHWVCTDVAIAETAAKDRLAVLPGCRLCLQTVTFPGSQRAWAASHLW